MQFFTNIKIKPFEPSIDYQHQLMLVGSCFTEHIGNYLADVKFPVLQNPHGILFDPISVCNSLTSYIENKQYKEADLVYINEAWHSWQHHSRFSAPDKNKVLEAIQQSQTRAHAFLKNTDWLFITLGSSFVYLLADNRTPVANCHKAPAQTFIKHLSTIEETIIQLDTLVYRLFQFNPFIKIIFTISPVRHLRDGVVDNNRSKARLIEAVHHIANKFENIYYFPAYELVIDVLRDYRFFDIDLAHPNYAATQFVLEKFSEVCMSPDTISLMEEIKKLITSAKHKPFNPKSQQHRQFLNTQLQKAQQLQAKYPFINLAKEIDFFTQSLS